MFIPYPCLTLREQYLSRSIISSFCLLSSSLKKAQNTQFKDEDTKDLLDCFVYSLNVKFKQKLHSLFNYSNDFNIFCFKSQKVDIIIEEVALGTMAFHHKEVNCKQYLLPGWDDIHFIYFFQS